MKLAILGKIQIFADGTCSKFESLATAKYRQNSLWERARGTFVTARIVIQGWVVMAMNVAQHPDNKEKVQLTFSAYRMSRKHLYLFRQHLSLLIRDYINGNTHLQADTRNSARDGSRVSFCSTQLLSFKKQLTHSILVKLKGNGAFRVAYII